MSILNRPVENNEEDYRLIPRRSFKIATRNPYFRMRLRDLSIFEDEENSYYAGILNTIAEHCVGTVPVLIGNHPVPEANDSVEDRWLEWALRNNIGTAIRHIRRGAARTGLGIGIPYLRSTPEEPVGLAIKTVSSTRLTTPRDATVNDRIIDGIEYDENWDPYKIYVAEPGELEPKDYYVKDIILWSKQVNEEERFLVPECGPAFCLYPSVKRYMDAIVRAEEFKACIPMAVELDSNVYSVDDATEVPTGAYKYEPGMVPTLPAGTKLTSVPVGAPAHERTQFISLMISAAARCVQMPKNIAMGDSSGHNMATASIDVQPWEDRVRIDRCDFRPAVDKVVKMWYDRAILISGYLHPAARSNFRYEIGHDKTFQHPDPLKRANARSIDLKSGSTTLHRVYTEQALNPRRELDREARTLGISREDLNKIIIATRAGLKDYVEEPGVEE
jgi:hypothetical protein